MFNWNYGINLRKYTFNDNLKKQNIGLKIFSEKVKTK